MKPTPDGQLLAALQRVVSITLSQWLDDNKPDLLRVAREAVLENANAKQARAQQQQQTTHRLFLTVAEVAQRWQLHPESVRRMIREGRIPRVLAGRHNRVAFATIEAIEKDGAVPSR